MPDYALARKNMVDCQLGPDGVTDPAILAAFASVPREAFVPAELRTLACLDEEIRFPDGRFLLAPSVHARLLEAAAPKPSDVALDIGGGAGYPAAILSHLVSTVIALEEDSEKLAQAAELWAEQSICTIAGLSGSPEKGAPAHAPYDLVFIDGAVAEIPEALTAQLAPGGRLATILREDPKLPGRAVLVLRETGDILSHRVLFDASAPYAPGFAPKPGFVFQKAGF